MMPKTEQGSKYYQGIDTHLEQINNERSISINGLDELIVKIKAKTGLSLEESEIVVRWFFQEIRNSMLRGDIVILAELGKFFISSPKTSKNKIRIFPKFKLFKKVIKKINEFMY